jgi:putative ABC transport system permease protein
MNGWTLVTANLRRRPTRTGLTLVSLAIAFLLFMLLRAIAAAFAGAAPSEGPKRVYVDAKYAMTDNLPIAAVQAIRDLPGVASTTPLTWFGGYYQTPQTRFAKQVVDHTQFTEVFPDLEVGSDTLTRFQSDKRAVIVDETLARQFGWHTGDVIPIVGDIWPKADGSWDWAFTLAGTYTARAGSRAQSTLFLRYDYFNDSVMDWVKNQAGAAIVRVADGVDPQHVIDAIDALFENSSDPTRSLSEDDYSRQFANQLGDIGLITTLILAAVFFTIVLLTANVTTLAFRERVPELAVMKTLGFQDSQIFTMVLAEALVLCIGGALVGVVLGFAIEPALNAILAPVIGRLAMTPWSAFQALAIAAAIGLIIGIPPAHAAQRLPIAAALREIA